MCVVLDRVQPFSLADYYLTSVLTGLQSLTGQFPREAAARVVNPLSYPRFLEYQLALGQHGPSSTGRILDIGSPKLPLLVLARRAQAEIYATDIRDYFIAPTAHFLERIGLGHRLGRDLHLEVQDARKLRYADNFFDQVFSISVIEHIPNDGDVQAMREIARVLRPGGIATLTVPFAADGLREEYVHGPVYERSAHGGPTFYQRHYDAAAVRERLVAPSGLQLLASVHFGEPGLHFERFWNRIPMRYKVPLLWAQPFLARLFLKPLPADRLDAACGVALTLEKPI
jgi:SAM-dependent methyltransferase